MYLITPAHYLQCMGWLGRRNPFLLAFSILAISVALIDEAGSGGE
jgi:hypothetical protein